MHFRVFSEGQGTLYIMGDIFGVAKILNIYLGCLKFLIFFLCVYTVDAGPEPTYKEKMRVPPRPLGFVHQFKHIPVKCI